MQDRLGTFSDEGLSGWQLRLFLEVPNLVKNYGDYISQLRPLKTTLTKAALAPIQNKLWFGKLKLKNAGKPHILIVGNGSFLAV
jgi:hypothetical protein